MIECDFSAPVNLQPNPRYVEDWAFSKVSCVDNSTSSTSSLPIYIEQITSSSTPQRSFYISKTIDLGQVLMLGFLILIFVFTIMISVKHLIFKKF
jgi:predicted S18 family serine protease